MSDGVYFFREGVVDGALSFGDVSDGQLITRSWTVAFNTDPDIQGVLDNGSLDVSKVSRFFDAELIDGDGNTLARVNQWTPTITKETIAWRPGGQKLGWKVPGGHTVGITFMEVLVQDGNLFKKVLDSLAAGAASESLVFQCRYKGRS